MVGVSRLTANVAVSAGRTTVGFFAAAMLALLLGFQLAGEVIAPGFMNNWEYLVLQTAGILLLVVIAHVRLRHQGGLSWPAQILIVSACYADHIGNDRYWYYEFSCYDKVTHFLGVAALAASAHDCLPGLLRRACPRGHRAARLSTAMAIGIAVGVGWEFYELFGDMLVRSSRVQGWRDSTSDLIFDTLGALVAVTVLRWRTRASRPFDINSTHRVSAAQAFRRFLSSVTWLSQPTAPVFWTAIGFAITLLLILERAPVSTAPVLLSCGMM